jgi:serine/threonine-protein kinase
MTSSTVVAGDNRGVSSPVGTLLDARYRIDAVVGTGGMSTVYRAFDTVLERQVAIKLMHRDIARDSAQLERFRREARAVAQLNHPHIVGVIDAGEETDPAHPDPANPTPYIVFEYIEGETLKARIRRLGRLGVPEAIAYAIEIARALHAAHERHIVHRDVKPQNVLIDAEGSARVTDFGIARTLDEDGLTHDGRVLGTTDYVSPEQALGHPVGPQSDLYSLGVVLFEMLTGDVPFHGENQVTVAMKHVREDLPDVQIRRPEVSASLVVVLERATAKDLARRTPDAATLIAELEDVLAIETARSGSATGEATNVLRSLRGSQRRRLPLRVRRSARVLVAVGLLAVVATVVLLALAAGQTERGTSAPRDTRPAPPGERTVRLAQTSAGDYDPFGGDGEHGDEAPFLVDGDRNTFWSTESYSGALNAQKPGVGAYVDADPGVEGTRIEIRSRTPGWSGTIYGARRNLPSEMPSDGWVKLADVDGAKSRERISLSTPERMRYYLVWITALPEDEERVELSEIVLFASERG